MSQPKIMLVPIPSTSIISHLYRRSTGEVPEAIYAYKTDTIFIHDILNYFSSVWQWAMMDVWSACCWLKSKKSPGLVENMCNWL